MNIYCSGIGGIGLSAYAAYQQASGHRVSGSDAIASDTTIELQSRGILVSHNQDGSGIPSNADYFVHSLAIDDAHPEMLRARALGLKVMTYFQALGELTMASGKTVIAICGTHGKSSTTAMAAKVMIDAGCDPSVIIGTKSKDLHGLNWRKGGGNYFLVEACEYRHSFLHLRPNIILVTNITGDHFDAFSDLADYQEAFMKFASLLPSDGICICHEKDRSLLMKTAKDSVKFIDTSDIPAPGLLIPGSHMQDNAKLVLALSQCLSISQAEAYLKDYQGSWRRTELRGSMPGGAIVIDDYAHHPNEISATLHGLRVAYPMNKLVCVFQPHTHDRIIKLYDKFIEAFRLADIVIIPNIYAARSDRDSTKVDVDRFTNDIEKHSQVHVIHADGLRGAEDLLRSKYSSDEYVIITMGAGDVVRIADALTLSGEHEP